MVFNSITPSAAARLSNQRNRQSNYLNSILGTPTERSTKNEIKTRLNRLKRNAYATEDPTKSVDTNRSRSKASRMSSAEIVNSVERSNPEKKKKKRLKKKLIKVDKSPDSHTPNISI